MFGWFFKFKKKTTLSDYLIANWSYSNSDTVRKNMEKNADHFKKVAGNVRAVSISKTADSGRSVITLIDADGNKASLWLYHDGGIQSITTY